MHSLEGPGLDKHGVLCCVVCSAALSNLEPHFVEAGLPTTGGVQAREFKTGSVSGYAKIRENGGQQSHA